jgi:hypothetical protein
MNLDKIIKAGAWYNADMMKRNVRITIEETRTVIGSVKDGIKYPDVEKGKWFGVWFESDQHPFSVNGGYYKSEYEAEVSVEKMVDQKVQWQAAT